MRIGFLSDRLWTREMRLSKFMAELRKDGHEFHVLSCPNGSPREGTTADGVRFFEPSLPVGFSKTWTLPYLLETYRDERSPWVAEIERFIDVTRPDVIHVNDLPLAWLAGVACRRHSIPMVVDYNEDWPACADALAEFRGPDLPWWNDRAEIVRFWEQVERDCFDFSDRIITVSDQKMRRLVDVGAEWGKLVLVRNTAQTEVLMGCPERNRPEWVKGEEFTLGYIGTFDIMKDVPGLVRGFASLPFFNGRPPRLLLVGRGEQEPALRRLIEDLGISDRVCLGGWLDPEHIRFAVEACRIGVIACRLHPYTHEGSSNKLYQYMLMGRPVITSPIRCTADQVREDGVGEVAELNSDRFVAAVRELLEPDRWEQCSANGREATERKYRWEDDADRLRHVYSSCAA